MRAPPGSEAAQIELVPAPQHLHARICVWEAAFAGGVLLCAAALEPLEAYGLRPSPSPETDPSGQ